MSAAELRQAAEALRQRAEAADAPPWTVTGVSGSEWDDLVVTDSSTGITADCDTSNENAAYIATMHPGVAVALADWLNFVAQGREAIDGIALARMLTHPDGPTELFRDTEAHALKVARLINGGAS